VIGTSVFAKQVKASLTILEKS